MLSALTVAIAMAGADACEHRVQIHEEHEQYARAHPEANYLASGLQGARRGAKEAHDDEPSDDAECDEEQGPDAGSVGWWLNSAAVWVEGRPLERSEELSLYPILNSAYAVNNTLNIAHRTMVRPPLAAAKGK